MPTHALIHFSPGGMFRSIWHIKTLTRFLVLNLYMPCAKGPRHTDIRTENRLVLNLFCRSPMVTFKENYHFPRFQVPGGFFFGGGGGGDCLFPIETHITYDFPRGPVPISLYLEVHIFFWISIFILRMIVWICPGSPEAMQQAEKCSLEWTLAGTERKMLLRFNAQICIISCLRARVCV